ncbi:MAG: carboxylate-amine ligase, partial [Gammaproteobacteria bacterium]
MSAPSLTLGIEEEYLLVNADSGDLITNPPATLLDECRELCGEQVSPEFLRSQIEIGTKVCKN